MKPKIKTTCTFPGCDRLARCRGLCNNHYQSAGACVRLGKITWAKLEECGKVKPPLRDKNRQYFLGD